MAAKRPGRDGNLKAGHVDGSLHKPEKKTKHSNEGSINMLTSVNNINGVKQIDDKFLADLHLYTKFQSKLAPTTVYFLQYECIAAKIYLGILKSMYRHYFTN